MEGFRGWFRKSVGNGGLPTEPTNVGGRSAVGVLGRSLVIVVGIVSATCLLITMLIAAVIVSPMIFWYLLRSESESAENKPTPKKQEYVNLNIDQILGVDGVQN